MRNSDSQVPSAISNIQFEFVPVDNERLVNLGGSVNGHLRQIEEYYDVKVSCRSNQFEVNGDGRQLKAVKNVIRTLSEFKKDKIIRIFGKEIDIIDKERLESISLHG